jgi:hypothetical protein
MERFLSRAAFSLGAGIAALIFVAAAILFLGAALYLVLVPSVPAPLAALIVAVAGLVVAGLIVLAVRLSSRRGRAGDVGEIAASIGSLAARELNSAAQNHPYRVLGLALVAGFVVGLVPELLNVVKGVRKN